MLFWRLGGSLCNSFDLVEDREDRRCSLGWVFHPLLAYALPAVNRVPINRVGKVSRRWRLLGARVWRSLRALISDVGTFCGLHATRLMFLQIEHLVLPLTAYSGTIYEYPSWRRKVVVESSLKHSIAFGSLRWGNWRCEGRKMVACHSFRMFVGIVHPFVYVPNPFEGLKRSLTRDSQWNLKINK